ncbi:ATPase AAA [Fibrobacteres bacterium R8-0-B4]
MKKLPVGKQIFEKVIAGGYQYVDKTRYIYDLIDSGIDQFFLARPRRFGKTFMCWTLDALFSGKRELFEGLAISKTDWTWESYPIIHLDMSEVKTAYGIDGVRKSLTDQMGDAAEKHGIDLRGETEPGRMLKLVIVKVSEKHGKPTVVIVDEYDKPFLDFYTKPPIAQEVREILRDCYINFKANEQHIRFLFMTGISKFAKMGVFSTLNQLTDISLKKGYGALLGYTEEELVENFGEHLESGAKNLGCSVDELVERMRLYYNGFCFDGVTKVYNPFSALNFLTDFEFMNYWMNSASPKIIADYMKDRSLTVEQFRGMQVSRMFVDSPGEMETAPPEGFLYQAGYLTLREGVSGDFSLDYPNTEVLESMSRLVYANIMRHRGDGGDWDISAPFIKALLDGNSGVMIKMLNRLLASIPYDDYAKAAQSSIELSGVSAGEWLYRSTILAFLRGCGVLAFGEMHTNKGRSDLLVCHRGAAWVIEIKVAYNDDGKTLAKEALEQINAKQYADPFKTAKKLGIAIDDKTRQINDWAGTSDAVNMT